MRSLGYLYGKLAEKQPEPIGRREMGRGQV